MKQLRIAVIEDEVIILSNFIMQIERMGHRVTAFAMDGNEAVSVIQQEKPDLVMIDINLPEKDGLEVVKEVCLPNRIPTIIVTGHCADGLIEKSNLPCVFGYLMKPVSADQIKAMIEIAWSRQEDYHECLEQVDSLNLALKERKEVERAKGILMDNFGLKEGESMKRLQRMAKDQRKKLIVIARQVIKANESMAL